MYDILYLFNRVSISPAACETLIFRNLEIMCLHHFKRSAIFCSSPPNPQKSYSNSRNSRNTFETPPFVHPKMAYWEGGFHAKSQNPRQPLMGEK